MNEYKPLKARTFTNNNSYLLYLYPNPDVVRKRKENEKWLMRDAGLP
jgi:hypothetical protein